MTKAPDRFPSYPKQVVQKALGGGKGCWVIIILMIVLIAACFYWADQDAKEEAVAWEGLRPQTTSSGVWAERLILCKEAGIAIRGCAAMQIKAVRRAAAAERARRHVEYCAQDRRRYAGQKAQEAARGMLKAPSTADFIQSDQRVEQDGCTYIVTGTVDAQNSFGAQLRSTYRAKLLRIDGDEWVLGDVQVY